MNEANSASIETGSLVPAPELGDFNRVVRFGFSIKHLAGKQDGFYGTKLWCQVRLYGEGESVLASNRLPSSTFVLCRSGTGAPKFEGKGAKRYCGGKEKTETVRMLPERAVNPKATITSKGQITIPRAIREALGLITGTQLTFELSGGELRVRPVSQRCWSDLWNIASAAPRPTKPVDIAAAIQTVVRERFDR